MDKPTLVTEDEALDKVCPIGSLRGSYDGNWDKGPCIGSKCMAWRWSTATTDNAPQPFTPEYTHGYCGLTSGSHG